MAPQQNNALQAQHEPVSAAEIATALDEYNAWRRGGTGEQPDPTALGLLIGAAANKLRSLEQQVSNIPSGMSFSQIGGNKYLKLRSEGYQNAGVAMQRIEPDGRVTRVWVGSHGMILWPRTECEAGIERAENSDLKRENARLRTAIRTKEETAGLYLRKYQELKRRMDELASLDSERAANAQLTAEIERLQSLRFPVELRKMWSGQEVQEWLNQQFAK